MASTRKGRRMQPIHTANLPRRFCFFLVGIFLSGTGIALLVKANIGSSAVPYFSYICTCIWPQLSLGTFTFLVNALFFIAQFFVEPGSFTPVKLLQLVPTALMGAAADANMLVFQWLNPQHYILQLLILLLGCLMFGLSIALMVHAEIILMPMDTLITLLARHTHFSWGNIKTVMDLSLLLVTLGLSLIFLHRLVGVREGTVIACICVGQFYRVMGRPARWLIWGSDRSGEKGEADPT